MADSVQTLLAMPDLTDSELLDQLLTCILSAPNGPERIAQVRAKMEGSDGPQPLTTKSQPLPTTDAATIRARLEESHDRLRSEYGDKEKQLAVLRDWYERNYKLLPGDLRDVSKGIGRTEPHWHKAFHNALKGCTAVQRVGHNRYRIA